MPCSRACRLRESLNEPDLQNRRLRTSVTRWTVFDFARDLDAGTHKWNKRTVECREPIPLAPGLFRGVRRACPGWNALLPRGVDEKELRIAENIQLVGGYGSSPVRRGPSHAAGHRYAICQRGRIGLWGARCRIARQATCSLCRETDRADAKDRHHVEKQSWHARCYTPVPPPHVQISSWWAVSRSGPVSSARVEPGRRAPRAPNAGLNVWPVPRVSCGGAAPRPAKS